jgi:hypothetical protein
MYHVKDESSLGGEYPHYLSPLFSLFSQRYQLTPLNRSISPSVIIWSKGYLFQDFACFVRETKHSPILHRELAEQKEEADVCDESTSEGGTHGRPAKLGPASS